MGRGRRDRRHDSRLDVIAFRFGIPYSSPWGHRGWTHSLFFAAAWAGFIVWRSAAPRSLRIGGYLFAAIASHGLLDALTNGGLGVGLLILITSRRFFFPWRPLEVCPIGWDWLFTSEVWFILKSEILWLWIPSAAVCMIGLLFRHYR